MSLYTSSANLIARFGVSISLDIVTDGAIDFATGKPSETVASTTMKAIMENYSSSEIREGIVNMDDIKVTLQYDGVIKKGDRVQYGFDTYTVMNVSKTVQDTQIIKQTLQVRL